MPRPQLSAFLILASLTTDAAAAEPAPPPREVRFDLTGDPLPPGAISRLGTTRFRMRGWHQQVFFSPDANTVIGKGEDSVLRFWDVVSGKVLDEIKDPDLSQWGADQSPDGKYLAVFGMDRRGKPAPDTTLRLYDLTTRTVVWTSVISEANRGGYFKVRFTPNGKRIVTAADDVRVWDAKSGDELLRQKIQTGYGGLDVSPDGKTIGVGYYQVYLWNWESGAEPQKLDAGLRTSIDGLRFSPDGRTLYLIGVVGTTRGIDVGTGKPAGRLETGPSARWITFSPDGRMYAAGYHRSSRRDGYIGLRETATGKEVMRLPCGTDEASAAAWSRDGSRLAAVASNRLWVWDLKTGKPFGPDLPSHEGMIGELAFAPDGRLFTASDDHTVRAWDPATGKQLMRLDMDGWVRGLALSRDGSLVAASALRNDFRVWDARTGKQVFKLHGHGDMGGHRRVRFSNDDQGLLSYGDDFYLRSWDTLTGKLKAEYRYRPKNPYAKEGADEEDDDRMMHFLGSRVMDLGPDGNTFVLADGKDVTVYAADTGKERFKLEADPQHVEALAISPDGKLLATAGPGVVPPKPKPGEMPARPTDFQVTVWDLTKAERVTRFRAPGSLFSGILIFTPDGRTLVSGAWQLPLRLWDVRTGTAVGTLDLPGRAGDVAFDGAGKRIAVAFPDSTAVVYDLAAVLVPPKKE